VAARRDAIEGEGIVVGEGGGVLVVLPRLQHVQLRPDIQVQRHDRVRPGQPGAGGQHVPVVVEQRLRAGHLRRRRPQEGVAAAHRELTAERAPPVLDADVRAHRVVEVGRLLRRRGQDRVLRRQRVRAPALVRQQRVAAQALRELRAELGVHRERIVLRDAGDLQRRQRERQVVGQVVGDVDVVLGARRAAEGHPGARPAPGEVVRRARHRREVRDQPLLRVGAEAPRAVGVDEDVAAQRRQREDAAAQPQPVRDARAGGDEDPQGLAARLEERVGRLAGERHLHAHQRLGRRGEAEPDADPIAQRAAEGQRQRRSEDERRRPRGVGLVAVELEGEVADQVADRDPLARHAGEPRRVEVGAVEGVAVAGAGAGHRRRPPPEAEQLERRADRARRPTSDHRDRGGGGDRDRGGPGHGPRP
jgi:hypothetical protein